MKNITIKRISEMSNEELLANYVDTKDPEIASQLLTNYKRLVYKKTNQFYCQGCEKEDLVQEGMIGLYIAITKYNGKSFKSFFKFASLCIDRKLYNFIAKSVNKQNEILNTYVSLNQSQDIEDEISYSEILADQYHMDPSKIIILKEFEQASLAEILKALSPIEQKVYFYYLHQLSYKEISHHVNKPVKTVDNAIQRIKKKLKQLQQQMCES